MPWGLRRYQETGDLHFVTFSCYRRRPHLGCVEARDVFLNALESVRVRHGCSVHGYVVMPEHVHLLLGEPTSVPLDMVLRALKLSVSKRLVERPDGTVLRLQCIYGQEADGEIGVYAPESGCEGIGASTGGLGLVEFSGLLDRRPWGGWD